MFSKISPKKYCKVCHDAGKSETEYTSHFIRENRDPCSKVVCPTLLSLECRYCSKKGHTVKYCKILEKDKIAETRQSKSSLTNTKPKSQEKYKQANNMFSNLESDSEDEEEQEVKEVKEKKEIEVRVPITTNIKSYASALLRPAIILKEVKIAPIITRQNNDIVPSYNNIKSTYIKNKSWADTDSDSDSELDEEKEEKEEVNDPNW
jgi:hypothetical protein